MTRCILCLKERLPSVEHVFPQAVGGYMIIRRVCEPCNSHLGSKVDVEISNHLSVMVKREELRLPGQKGHVPKSFLYIMQDAVLADTNEPLVHSFDEAGKIVLRTRYSETSDDEGNTQVRLDPSDLEHLPAIINKKRMRAGFPPLTNLEERQLLEQARQSIETIERPCAIGAKPSPCITVRRPHLFMTFEKDSLGGL